MPISGGQSITPLVIWSYLNGVEEICEDTLVTAGGTNNFGAWIQLTAATIRAIHAINVGFAEASIAAHSAQDVEIGVGAAAAEVAVCAVQASEGEATEDFGFGGNTFALCNIPAGSRVSMRIRSRVGNNVTFRVTVKGMVNT